MLCHTDWDDAQTDLAHLNGGAPGAAKSGGDKLWEDNWDDDDVEDDFSVQLRYVSHNCFQSRPLITFKERAGEEEEQRRSQALVQSVHTR